MEETMVERVCIHCGKTIQVPAELESYACVFCGGRMNAQDAEAFAERTYDQADYDFVMEHLYDGIEEHPKFAVKKFNRKNYEDSYYEYKKDCRAVYEAMDRCVVACPAKREELIERFTDRFLELWAEGHKLRKWKKEEFSDKLTLAFYEVPAMQDMELSVAPDYVEALERKFNAKYPDNIFHAATFEDLKRGFRKRKWCFITTAICEYKGKPDDCAELTAFRSFRDGWLREHGGEELIEEYYDVAPLLVNIIDYCEDRDARYEALRRDYLTPCYEALQRGEPEQCRDRYTAMVRSLMQEYGLS